MRPEDTSPTKISCVRLVNAPAAEAAFWGGDNPPPEGGVYPFLLAKCFGVAKFIYGLWPGLRAEDASCPRGRGRTKAQ